MRLLLLLIFVSCAPPLAALPVRVPAPNPNQPGPGELTAKDIMEVVVANAGGCKACVKAPNRDFSEHGKILLVWDVRPDGTVDNAAVREAAYAAHPLAHCLVNALKTWRFSPTEKGGAAVVFPVKF